MDWDHFLPIPGIDQIVGHSAGPDVREKHGERSRNFCIDVGDASAVAILDEGKPMFSTGVAGH